ncbi:hypothetical protein CZ771_09160 [Actinomycetales bacterium JB111]|nr:hypothetical protein CZ771_09160 [Actinomycetales bacterium JB111]
MRGSAGRSPVVTHLSSPVAAVVQSMRRRRGTARRITEV